MIRFASGYGSGRSRTALTMLKMAVFAPMPSARVMIATAANPGFLINCRKASRRLFITECNRWIEGVDFEENILERRSSYDSEEQSNATGAKNKADRELPRPLSHDHSKNSFRVCSKGHPNAKLLGPLVHRKAHHAVETNR